MFLVLLATNLTASDVLMDAISFVFGYLASRNFLHWFNAWGCEKISEKLSFSEEFLLVIKQWEIFKIISDCIQYIWEGDEIFQAKDSTKQELNDFIESLNAEQFADVRGFFENMPKLTKDVTWKCSKCEKTTEVKLQGIDAFFA